MSGAVDGPPATPATPATPAAPATPATPATRGRVSLLEAVVLVGILVLAAAVRLPGLDARGQWDADQGTDMLVLRALVEDGEVPLLGPRTSIGTFHHGALYYWLLAPSAFLSDADPVAVTFELALLGIGAVAATWWLARLLGGPVAAVTAGLLMAVSPAGIDESTFIWNPNPIPLFAALAFGGAIVARRTGRTRWWLLSGAGAMATMQLHILGVVILVPLAWAWVADILARRRRGDGAGTRAALLGGIGALVIVAAGYVPLAIHELRNGFSETSAIFAYLTGGAPGAAGGALSRIVIVGLRSITWPFAGVLTDRVAASLVVALVVIVLAGLAVVRSRHGDHDAPDTGSARWLVGAFGICVVLLALFAPSLATITPGLPNDHYHNLLDPVVVAIVGLGLARLWTLTADRGLRVGQVVAAGLATVLVAVGVTAWPPAVSPDGGWPLADRAAAQVLTITGDAPTSLDGLPEFKNDNALRFPLERRGALLLPPGVVDRAHWWVLVCDPLFDEATGLPCGGTAEQVWIATTPGVPPTVLRDHFNAGPRRVISIYEPGPYAVARR